MDMCTYTSCSRLITPAVAALMLVMASSAIAYETRGTTRTNVSTTSVNRNVSASAAYDEKQDLARAPMETAQIPQPSDALEVAFAHVGPRCTLRIYFGKSASFADFTAK